MKSSLHVLHYSLFTILICLVVYSCNPDPKKIYESNVSIPTKEWHRNDIARFVIDITDTVNLCNIYINVRNNTNFKYMNLWLFVDMHSPMGFVERDTVSIMLADHRGKWLGHGLGSKFNTRIFLRRNVRFPVAGEYIFEYEQAMRDETLTGIEDIGLRIERVGK